MFLYKSKIAFLLYFSILFTGIGYINCDALFYKKIIREGNIKTPEEAFFYVLKNTKRHSSTDVVISGLPMRDKIVENRGFWCDEGAIFLGKLLDYSSTEHPYHLTDIIGMDNISHHTLLQVFENSTWKTYDVVPANINHEPHFDGNPINCVDYQVKNLRYREWTKQQKLYHFIIENNTLLKRFFMKIRGIY